MTRQEEDYLIGEELLVEDLLEVEDGGRAAFVEPYDNDYDWSTER